MISVYDPSIEEQYITAEGHNFYHRDKPAKGNKGFPDLSRVAIIGGKHLGVTDLGPFLGPVKLTFDPQNPFDPKAIKVLYEDKQIGWVPRGYTYLFHRLTKHDKFVTGTSQYLYIVHGNNRQTNLSRRVSKNSIGLPVEKSEWASWLLREF
jgi:hypothetical protein